ncbi:hypothetical protein SVIOM74S_06528 [Streptomyces violarus]
MAAPPSPYRHAGFFLLRTPALPASTFHRLTDDAALSALSGTPRVRRALEVASPSLGAALREGHEPGDGKRGRRIRSGLLRYLTRMSTRPTPYGAFAAVTMGEFGPRTTARLGAGAVGRQRIRADMGWLMLFVREAQQRVGAADGLALVWNALAHPSGERIVLPQADAYGQGEGKAARILDTEAVRLVRERTRGPVPCPYGEVVAELSAAFPDAPAERLKLYSCFDRHDEILAGPLRALADALRRDGRADRWFFIRYADPRPHLRIRFRAPGQATPAEHGALLTELLAFGRDMVRRGLAGDLEIASYEPEVVRYGGPRVHDAIERLFEAGSDTALQVVDRMWGGELDMRAEFVAVAVLDALYDRWGLDVRARFAVAPGAAGAEETAARSLYREHRDYLGELLAPWDLRPHPRGRADHAALAPLLVTQAAAAAGAGRAVRDAAARGELWGTEEDVLASLAHMTVNRLLPVDLSREERIYGVWKNVLRTIGGRPA